MECFLSDGAGRSFKLPRLLEWSFSYGCGRPCDSFEITAAFDESMADIMETAIRFKAVHGGETVFFGVVDEAETEASEDGALCFIRGRGMQALLLDNEAEAAQFYSAGPEMVLEKYVYPFGIKDIRKTVTPGSIALTVSSGESAWRALEDYMRFSCAVSPRFLKNGTLLLGEQEGRRLKICERTAVSRVCYKRTRYGVISEVLVKNKALGSQSRVLNETFLNEGGACRRIVNVPRYTRFDAMRATGEYQIAASRERERCISLTVAELFGAFPGDVVELSGIKTAPAGTYFVGESRCFGNARGAGTDIVLTKREA